MSRVPLPYLCWLIDAVKDEPELRREARLTLHHNLGKLKRAREVASNFGSDELVADCEKMLRKAEVLYG